MLVYKMSIKMWCGLVLMCFVHKSMLRPQAMVRIGDLPPRYEVPQGAHTFFKQDFFSDLTGENEAAFAARHIGSDKAAPSRSCECNTCKLVNNYCKNMRTDTRSIDELRNAEKGVALPGGGTFSVVTGQPSKVGPRGERYWASQADVWRRLLDIGWLQAVCADEHASVAFQIASRFNALPGGCLHLVFKQNDPRKGSLTQIAGHSAQEEEATVSASLRGIHGMYFAPPVTLLGGFQTRRTVGSRYFELHGADDGGLDPEKSMWSGSLSADDVGQPHFVDAFCAYYSPYCVNNVVVTAGFSNTGNDTQRANAPNHRHVAIRLADGRPDLRKCVSQIFVAALNLNDYDVATRQTVQMQSLARLLLHAAYEGTLRSSHVSGKRKLVLTGVGTGMFHNEWQWVVDALARMQDFIRRSGMEVCLVIPVEPPTDIVQGLSHIVASTGGGYLVFNEQGVHARQCGGSSVQRAQERWQALRALCVEGGEEHDQDGGGLGGPGGAGAATADGGGLLGQLGAVKTSLTMLQARLRALSLSLGKGGERVPHAAEAGGTCGGGGGMVPPVPDGLSVCSLGSLLRPGEVFITLVCGDMTQQRFANQRQAAIVNAANSIMLGGGGIDGVIHAAAQVSVQVAGSKVDRALRLECSYVPGHDNRCPTGQARLTWGHGLAPVRIVHAVGPMCSSRGQLQSGEQKLLESAYAHSLACVDALQYPGWESFWKAYKAQLSSQVYYRGCTDKVPTSEPIQSIAFCSISTALFGCNMQASTDVAIAQSLKYLSENLGSSIREVRFVTYSANDFAVYQAKLSAQARLVPLPAIPAGLRLSESSMSSMPQPLCFVFNRGGDTPKHDGDARVPGVDGSDQPPARHAAAAAAAVEPEVPRDTSAYWVDASLGTPLTAAEYAENALRIQQQAIAWLEARGVDVTSLLRSQNFKDIITMIRNFLPVSRTHAATVLGIAAAQALVSTDLLKKIDWNRLCLNFMSPQLTGSNVHAVDEFLERMGWLFVNTKQAREKHIGQRMSQNDLKLMMYESWRQIITASAVPSFVYKGTYEGKVNPDESRTCVEFCNECRSNIRRGGLGASVDNVVGSDKYVFAILGPQLGFLYGNWVWIMKREVLMHPATWITPVAAMFFTDKEGSLYSAMPYFPEALKSLGSKELLKMYKMHAQTVSLSGNYREEGDCAAALALHAITLMIVNSKKPLYAALKERWMCSDDRWHQVNANQVREYWVSRIEMNSSNQQKQTHQLPEVHFPPTSIENVAGLVISYREHGDPTNTDKEQNSAIIAKLQTLLGNRVILSQETTSEKMNGLGRRGSMSTEDMMRFIEAHGGE